MSGEYFDSEAHPEIERPVPRPSLAELYHENSKQRRHDRRFGLRIAAMNNSPALQQVFAGARKRYRGVPTVALPESTELDGRSFESVVAARRSVSSFAGGALPAAHLSSILALGTGITSRSGRGIAERPLRAAPSAGALYPIETYVGVSQVDHVAAGVYHYAVAGHCLERLSDADIASQLGRASSYERLFKTASATLILTGILGRTQIKYQERGYRFMLMEAGHIAENILLCATALGLSATPVGGFIDDEVAALLDVDGVDETVLTLIPVGPPANEHDLARPDETDAMAELLARISTNVT
jgi:SagB-type dehydrogenase family enzyme